MANPYDIPRSSGNTFLIFSAIAVGSSTGPGVVKLAPTVEAVTGFFYSVIKFYLTTALDFLHGMLYTVYRAVIGL